jgi:PKD repeat protein
LEDGKIYYWKVRASDGLCWGDWSGEWSFKVSISTPVLSYSPSSHNFGDMCEGETDSTTFEIWNSGSGTLTYSLSENCGWVGVSPTSGSSTGAHDTITVNVDTTGLSEGSHTGDIAISSDDGSGTFTVTVNVVSCEEPVLSYSPASYNFGDKCERETDSTTFEIWNSGSGTLTYSLSENCGWVGVSPTSGSSTEEHDTITVDIDTTGLPVGSHTCDISISSNKGSGTFTVDVTVIDIPVLLVHGFGGSPTGTWGTMKERLENDGFKVETVLLEPYGDIKDNANVLAQKIHGKGGMLDQYNVNKVDIVAHSLGGLVSRWYIQHDAYRNDVNKLIMLGTPNHGVWDANLAAAVGYVNPAAEQMIPNSPILNNLNNGILNLNVDHYVIMGRGWLTSIGFYTKTCEGDGLVLVRSAALCSARENYQTYDAHADIIYRIKSCTARALLNNGGTHENSEGGTLTTSLAAYSYVKSILQEHDGGQSNFVQQIATNDQQTDTYIQPPKTFNDTIHPGENRTYSISINSTDVKVDFRVCWGDGDLALVLYTPNGTVINKSTAMNNSNIDYFENTAYKFRHYAVQNPETGNWTMEITAINVSNSGENYTALIYSETSLILDISVDKYLFDPNQYMNISTNLMNNDTAVIEASVTAKIHKPDNTTENITLYDDGLHRDNQTNDGIYANTYTNTSISGTYHIAASATGTLDGEEFERTASTTVWIEQYPDLTLSSSDIYLSNYAASAGDNITINTTIHNIGDADANNASILFYDGAPVSGTYIGNDTITVASEGMADASVSWTVIGGDHEMYVVVSPYNAFIEANYSNNQAHKLIQVNQPPNASFTYSPSTPVVNQTITFNASSSCDPDDGFITNYEWNFDDGNTTNTTNPITSHSYSSAGNYSVTLTVTDDDGAMNSTSTVIEVGVTSVIPLPDYADPPTDPDQDGLYEDMNGNMMVDFNDIVLYFQYMDWIEANEPIACFDFNGNGLIDFDDLVKLFEEV